MTTQAYDTPSFKQTYQFYRYINANPASALATQFVNAIAAAQSQATEAAATAEIDSFFRNTGIYSAVSLDSFLEMAEWLFTTLPAWAGFAQHYTYHLKVAGANGAQDVGKVVFNQAGGEDEAYSVSYLALDGSKTPLYYQAAQLVDDLTADNPAMRLQTSFAALGLFTGNPDDAETPVSVLCGTVHGQQSLALSAQNDGDGQNPAPSWQLSDIIGVTLAGIMVIVSLVYCVYVVVSAYRVQATRQRLREQQRRAALEGQKLLQENNPEDQKQDSPKDKLAEKFDKSSKMIDEQHGGKWTLEKLDATRINPNSKQQQPINKITIEDNLEKLTNEEKNTLFRSHGLEQSGYRNDSKPAAIEIIKNRLNGLQSEPDKLAFSRFLNNPINRDASIRAEVMIKAENKFKDFGSTLYKKCKSELGGADVDGINLILNNIINKLRDVDYYDNKAVDDALAYAKNKLDLLEMNIDNYVVKYGFKPEEKLEAFESSQQFDQNIIAATENTENLIKKPISDSIPAIKQLQQDSTSQTLALENQRQMDAITQQLQAQQDQETDMAKILGTNSELEQCARQTNNNLKEMDKIDPSTKDAATQLATIAKNVETTQAQLDELAQDNAQNFSNAVQKNLEADNQTIEEEQNKDDQAKKYEETINQTE